MKTIRPLLILIIACLAGYSGFSQNNPVTSRNHFKISPFKIADLVNPGFELSYEHLYKNRLSTQLSVAYLTDPFKVTPFDDYTGYRFGIEQKFFSIKSFKKYRRYTSVEFLYQDVAYNDASTYVRDTALNTPEYEDKFRVSKQHYSLNIKQGVQVPLKRFILDMGIGLGIKFKTTNRIGVDDRQAIEIKAVDLNAYDIASAEGDHVLFNMPVTIRIGYTF